MDVVEEYNEFLQDDLLIIEDIETEGSLSPIWNTNYGFFTIIIAGRKVPACYFLKNLKKNLIFY